MKDRTIQDIKFVGIEFTNRPRNYAHCEGIRGESRKEILAWEMWPTEVAPPLRQTLSNPATGLGDVVDPMSEDATATGAGKGKSLGLGLVWAGLWRRTEPVYGRMEEQRSGLGLGLHLGPVERNKGEHQCNIHTIQPKQRALINIARLQE